MITARGLVLVCAGVMVFVLAEVTRIGWLLLFDAVLWGATVINAVMPWLATGGLHARRNVVGWDGRGDKPGPMEDDAVEFQVKLENRGLSPAIFVTVNFNCAGRPTDPQKERLLIAWLGGHRQMSATARVRFDRRGLHRLPAVTVESRVPFGLFRRSRHLGEPGQIIVLPKVYPIGRLDVLGGNNGVSLRSVPARVGEHVIGSRSHVPGEPIKHIHWRNSARTGQPHIKEFEDASDSTLSVVLGMYRDQEPGGYAFDHAVRIAASVGYFVCRSGRTVRVVAGRFHLETSDPDELLRQLALLEDGQEVATAELLRVGLADSTALAIVQDTDADAIDALSRIARSPRRTVAIVLRGFGTSAPQRDPTDVLHQAGITAVECRPAGIADALSSLERAHHGQRRSAPMRTRL